MTNSLLNDIKELASSGSLENQTVTKSAYVRPVTPEGVTTARLIGYVELGYQPQRPYQGQEKPDAPMVTLTWELNGPAYMKNVAKEGEAENIVPTIHRETIKLSTNERAKYFKLFNKMRRPNSDVLHMAQMVGSGCIIRIKHNLSKKDPSIKYANIYTPVDGWMVSPPIETSAATNETREVPVPAAVGPLQVFLWSAPSMDQWNSLYQDGTYTRKVDGVDVELSRNFVQFKILGASNLSGSKLESMLIENNALKTTLEAKAISDSAYNNTKPVVVETPAPVAVAAAVEDNPLELLGLA
jgi:hypothetical protein